MYESGFERSFDNNTEDNINCNVMENLVEIMKSVKERPYNKSINSNKFVGNKIKESVVQEKHLLLKTMKNKKNIKFKFFISLIFIKLVNKKLWSEIE